MKTTERCDSVRPNTELEALLTDDQRRTITIDDHLAFRESLAGPKRKLSEANRLIEILDELESSDA